MLDRPLDRPERAPTLPVPAGIGRGFVLASVFVCAACGLVYELELVAAASSLAGDSVTQTSVVLSVMVFAMGIGSLLAKRLRCRAASGFGLVEALLAVVGGGSAMALYAFFAWFGDLRVALAGFAFAIGVLIGAEMPLLMTLIQRIRWQDPGGAVADLFAADYVGALVGGLTFPFLLLPFFGQLTGTLLTGVVNALAGGVVVLWLFRRDVTARVRYGMLAVNGGVVLLLVAGTAVVGPFEDAARHAVYGAGVRVAVRSDVQEIVLTGPADPRAYERGADPMELYLDGRLRARSDDAHRYREALVRPAMSGGPHGRVLVLGGGDGLALREVLRYPDVREVTVVERDPAVLRLARTDPGLRRLNGGCFDDPRVHAVPADPFRWLRRRAEEREEGEEGRGDGGTRGVDGRPYDVIVSDLPGPSVSTARMFYSQEFYGLAERALAPGGRLAVHGGSAGGRPRDFWTVDATVRAAGLRTSPYVVGSRASGTAAEGVSAQEPDWGFVLARSGGAARVVDGGSAPAGASPMLLAAANEPALRVFTAHELRAAHARAERHRITGLPPSTLMRPRY